MSDLFSNAKSSAKTAIWSKGVTLAESNKVTLEQGGDDELVFRVQAGGRPIPPLVVLYPADGEWTCDCGSDHDPCEHVVAAILAHRKAEKGGERLKNSSEVLPELAYRLESQPGPRLLIHRVLVRPDGGETPLQEPLARLLAAKKLPLQPTHEDLEIDRILVQSGHGATRAGTSHGLAAEGYEKVLRALAVARNLKLDGATVKVDGTPLVPNAVLRDEPVGEDDLGFLLEIVAPDARILDRGVALEGDVLRPLGATKLLGARWERLPLRKVFPSKDLGEFVTRFLPDLEEEIPVVVNSKRVPNRGGSLPPRIHFDFTPAGHSLSVLPLLVYGSPPRVRIDGDQVVHLQGEIPKRDVNRERYLVHTLRSDLNLAVGRVVHFDGPDAVKMAKRLADFEKKYAGSEQSQELRRTKLKVELDLSETAFSVTFRTDDERTEEVSFEHAYRSYRDGLPMVPLQTGGFAELPANWLERYGERIALLLSSRRPDGRLPLFSAPELGELADELGAPAPVSFSRLAPLFDTFERLPPLSLPGPLHAELRPYQELGVRWLRFLQNNGLSAVLADDMGLGKTLQAIAVFEGPTLVVCPKSLLFNWVAELSRFRPELRVSTYHGAKRKLDPSDVVVTTYSMLRSDVEELAKGNFSAVVLDEAQAIKNPDSQVAKAAQRLTDLLPPDTFKLLLSGTPIENSLDEMWSLFRITHPGLLGSRRDFAERFERPILAGDSSQASRLRRLLKPFLLRRLKKDVLRELPPRTDVVLEIELDPEQMKIYETVLALTREEVRAALEGEGGMMAALTALLRLRQAACHTGLLPGINEHFSAKFDALLGALQDATSENHKCILFSQWTKLLDLLEPELRSRGIDFVRLDGSTVDRARVVEAFQAENGPPVFLSSLKAGGVGLNLTAADHVFLLDPWWNPAAEDQAADRAHRIGQERPVTVYRLIARDTIEPSILELSKRKRQLAEVALEEGGAAQGLTRDDLLALLDLG